MAEPSKAKRPPPEAWRVWYNLREQQRRRKKKEPTYASI
jgi:hypothetical protein